MRRLWCPRERSTNYAGKLLNLLPCRIFFGLVGLSSKANIRILILISWRKYLLIRKNIFNIFVSSLIVKSNNKLTAMVRVCLRESGGRERERETTNHFLYVTELRKEIF